MGVAAAPTAVLVCADVDALKVTRLRRAEADIGEEGLAEVVGQAVVVDTRNLLDPAVVGLAGFRWTGLGARQPALR
jgi:UDP-glucose 6-dehydrogenase